MPVELNLHNYNTSDRVEKIRKMARKTQRFQLMLTPMEFTQLSRLAEYHHSSKGLILRQALQARIRTEIEAIPTCADGQRCVAPHLVPAQERTI